MEIRKNRIFINGKEAEFLADDIFQQQQERPKKKRNYGIIGLYIFLYIIIWMVFNHLRWGYHFSLMAEFIANMLVFLPFVVLFFFLVWFAFRLWRQKISFSLSVSGSGTKLSLGSVLVIFILVFSYFQSGQMLVNDIKDCFGGTITREITVTAFTKRNEPRRALRSPHASYYMKGFLDDGTPINIGVSFCFGGWLAVPGRSAKTKFIETMPHSYSDTVRGKITYHPHSLKFIKFEKL